jgi:S-formylglutathione hydrolase FrmB
VTLEQSEMFVQRAGRLGHRVTLVVHPGGKHGWWSMPLDIRQFAKFFDQHLLPSAN